MAINRTEYSPNYTVVGNPTITNDFVVSNFSTSNYLISEGKSVLTVADVTSFEIVIDITTGSSLSPHGRIIQPLSALNTNADAANSPYITIENSTIKFVFYNGSNYYSCVTGLNTLATNTRYLFKWTYRNNRGVEGYYSTDGGDTWEGNILLNWRQIQWAEREFVLGTRGSGFDTTFRGSIHLENCYIKVNDEMWWQPLLEEQVDVSGSVKISKGYYSDGLNKINMPASSYNFDSLTSNQTLGGKNKLFAYTDSTDSVGALITSTTPTGSFKITKDLEHPVYLDPTKNYIAGGELIEPEISFTSGTAEVWEQPILTSPTSYGTCTDSRNNTSESQEGWRALDGNSGTDFSPACEGGWWKWVVPDTLIFKAGTSTIVVTSGNPATPMDIQFFADEAATKPLTNVITLPSTVGQVTTAQVINTEVTSTIYMTIASHSNWSEINEISFVDVFKGSVEASVSSTKALQYSEDQDTAYWIPSEATSSLDSVKASQSVGPVNDLYLTTTTGTPTASLSFSNNGAIAGITTKLPLKQKVYLNNETDKILGVQERPDEVVISRNVTKNYTVVGSPTITNNYVASNFSSSNWLVPTINIPQPTGTDVLEIFMKVRVPSSYSENKCIFYRSDKDRGFYIQNSSKKFAFYDGNSRLNITATAGQTYWIGYSQDANMACKLAAMLDDGTYASVDELPDLSDSAWGSPTTWTSSEFTMVGSTFYLGRYNSSGKTWADGWIYLQDTVARVVSSGGTPTTLNWKAVDIQDGVSASGWSHYGPTKTFQFMGGVSFRSVAVTPAESYSISELSPPTTSLLTYPIFYTLEGDLALNKSYQSGYSWYTGYKVTFTDTTHTTIDSVEKTGTRCRLYCAKTGPEVGTHGQELTYYAVTIPQFEAGMLSGTQIKKEAIINMNLGLIPLTFTNTVTVGTEVVYSSTADTITEGSTTAIFVGEFIVEV